jgi:Zn-dependent peptidase ImmA (M78 family)
VVVSEDYVQSSKLDGVSRWFDKNPVMLLGKDKQGAVRRRFDVAHELGHLILHQNVSREDLINDLALIEEQAMSFAGSFLLPASSFSSDVADFSLDTLSDLKPKWKVSIGAMIKRLGNLELVKPEHERNLWKYYSYRKWRGNEPYDDRLKMETPLNLKAAIEMVAEDGPAEISILMSEIGLLPTDVADLTGVDVSVLNTAKSKNAKLKLVRKDGLDTQRRAAND